MSADAKLDTPTKPVISEREASFHVATAGIEARRAAMEAGAAPHALRALVHASRAQDGGPPAVPPGSRKLRSQVMRGDDLHVCLCFMLYQRVFGVDPRNVLAGLGQDHHTGTGPEQMTAIAALAFIYCQTLDAWDLLDRAADPESPDDVREGWKRDFRRLALDFAGPFTAADIEAVGAHVIDLARLAAQNLAEAEPGNARTPAAP